MTKDPEVTPEDKDQTDQRDRWDDEAQMVTRDLQVLLCDYVRKNSVLERLLEEGLKCYLVY